MFWSPYIYSKKLLNNIVNVCSKIYGVELESQCNIFSHRVEENAKITLSEKNHVLFMYYELMPSGYRYRCLKVNPRAQKSYIP